MNSGGQLGHTDSSVTSPIKLKTASGCPLWDIAVGQLHSAAIGDGECGIPDIYYTGSQGLETSENQDKTCQFLPLKLRTVSLNM